MPALDPALEAVVEAHWQTALASHRLFNGRVFCADRITSNRIEGHWTEYRRIVAQMADFSLFEALSVRSLAVCGVLRCPDGIAIGRRDPASLYQPGLWQLPPAGSVDQAAAIPGSPTGAPPFSEAADWRTALLNELHEELGLTAADVTALHPLCLIQHPSGVLDLGIRIETPLAAADILARHRTHGDGEYDRLQILPAATLAATIEAQGGILVPAARLLLDAACLTPPA